MSRSAPVRVVVVTFSPGQALQVFLDTLRNAVERPYDVVLVDNGSTDGSVECAAGRPGVELRQAGRNLGYGSAANLGVGGGEGEWVVVANPDVEWHPRALEVLLEAGERWPRAGVLGPAILTTEGDLYPSARELPSLARGAGHALLGSWWPSNPWTRAYRREAGVPTEGGTGWLSGSCMLLRRSAFEAVGGFDPGYFMYFEDLDLCRRLSAAGWNSVYVPTAVVTHTGAHATSKHQVAMLRAHHRSAYRYLSRTHPGLRWLPLRAVLATGLLGRYLLARVFPRLREGARPTRPGGVLS